MKKKIAFLLGIIVISILGSNMVLANENEFIIRKKFEYQNTSSKKLNKGFAEIKLGQINFTEYGKDKYIKIYPVPNKVEKDEYGNYYAYYELKNMEPGAKLEIEWERRISISSYTSKQTIAQTAMTEVNEKNKIYTEAAKKIESNNEEIVAKAHEITNGMKTDYRKASAIYEFVNTKMQMDTSADYAGKGALSGLKTLRGTNEEFTDLFVALCRAENIPAKAITGYRIKDTAGKREYLDTMWAEIYLKDYGWLPVDPNIIYNVNGVRVAYMPAFLSFSTAIRIPTDIYNGARGNRSFQSVKENMYTSKVYSMADLKYTQNQFQDIKSLEWAIDSIQKLYELGIVKGYSEKEYGPQKNISRIEFMAMLSRILKSQNRSTVSNAQPYYYATYDVNHWSKADYDFLMKCYQYYAKGNDAEAGRSVLVEVFEEEADLNKEISRREAVALMNLFLKTNKASSNSFADVTSSTKNANAIEKAYALGIITGYPDGTFKPDNLITRAEIAAVLARFLDADYYVVK